MGVYSQLWVYILVSKPSFSGEVYFTDLLQWFCSFIDLFSISKRKFDKVSDWILINNWVWALINIDWMELGYCPIKCFVIVPNFVSHINLDLLWIEQFLVLFSAAFPLILVSNFSLRFAEVLHLFKPLLVEFYCFSFWFSMYNLW